MSSNKYFMLGFILFFTAITTGITVLIRDNVDNSILKFCLAFVAVTLMVLFGALVASWVNKRDAHMNLISSAIVGYFTLNFRLKSQDVHDHLRFAVRFKHSSFVLNFSITTLYDSIPVDVFESGNLFRMKTAEKVKNELLNWDLIKHEAVCYNRYLEKVIDKL